MTDSKPTDVNLKQLNTKISKSSFNALSLIKTHSGKKFKELIEGWIQDEFFRLKREGAFKDLID